MVGVVFVRVFFILLVPVLAMAEAPDAEQGFELKVAKLTSTPAKDKATHRQLFGAIGKPTQRSPAQNQLSTGRDELERVRQTDRHIVICEI